MRNHALVITVAITTAILLAGIDVGTKWFVATVVMDPPRRIPVLPFFDMVLVYNRGVSFGLLGELGAFGPLILSGLAVTIIGFLGVWLWRAKHRGEVFSIASIIGGASGNVVDRLQDGAVTDFIDLYAGSYHWPAFNFADVFIVFGVLCLLAFSLRDQNGSNRKVSEKSTVESGITTESTGTKQ